MLKLCILEYLFLLIDETRSTTIPHITHFLEKNCVLWTQLMQNSTTGTYISQKTEQMETVLGYAGTRCKRKWYSTANIFEVIFTVFNCVRISTVISLYGLHFTAAPSTV